MSGKGNLKTILTMAIVGGAALLVVGMILNKFRPQSTLEAFPVYTYLENQENLYGNNYLLEAEIHSQIGVEEGLGRIFAVRPVDQGDRVPVYVDDALNMNINVGQRYRMEVLIRKGGRIDVQTMEKF